jgi:hypothetical protein
MLFVPCIWFVGNFSVGAGSGVATGPLCSQSYTASAGALLSYCLVCLYLLGGALSCFYAVIQEIRFGGGLETRYYLPSKVAFGHLYIWHWGLVDRQLQLTMVCFAPN